MADEARDGIGRRGALASLAALVAGPGVVWLLVGDPPESDRAQAKAPAKPSWTWDAVARSVVGLSASEIALVARAAPDPESAATLSMAARAWRSPAEAREHAGLASREDFRTGRVAWVEGWLLSTTDVGLCVLAARESPTPGAG